MNKICGYNCEHNKGGQCQITYCDKIGEITTTTQWLSGGRQQGKTYQLIKDQQKEIERLNNIINKIFEWMQDKYDNSDLTGFTVSFQELQDLKELKEGKSDE